MATQFDEDIGFPVARAVGNAASRVGSMGVFNKAPAGIADIKSAGLGLAQGAGDIYRTTKNYYSQNMDAPAAPAASPSTYKPDPNTDALLANTAQYLKTGKYTSLESPTQASVRAIDNALPTTGSSTADLNARAMADYNAKMSAKPASQEALTAAEQAALSGVASDPAIVASAKAKMGNAPSQPNISSNYTPPEEPQRMGLGRILANARLSMGQRLVNRNYANATTTIGVRG